MDLALAEYTRAQQIAPNDMRSAVGIFYVKHHLSVPNAEDAKLYLPAKN